MANSGPGSNQILNGLPQAEREHAYRLSTPVELLSGSTLLQPGEPYRGVYFPTDGLISAIGMLDEGQRVEIAAIGREGMIGLGTVLGVPKVRTSFVAQVTTRAYQMPADLFKGMFDESPILRGLVLTHAGRLLSDLARSAICNRFHSHHERLARWLIVTVQKTGRMSLPLTHDFIAQMLGGPRHLVSAELAALRAIGAIDYHRGEITIVDIDKVIAQSCDCIAPE